MATALESISKLTKDLKAASITLSDREVRYLVDGYYAIQDYRMQADAQAREAGKAGEPHAVLAWLGDNMTTLEAQIKRALGAYAESRRPGRWALSQLGIGPVITAGLLAHLSVEPWRCAAAKDRCSEAQPDPTHQVCGKQRINAAGAFWRFAGLDPTVEWDKGEKRPWNAKLKVLCWKIGQSFLKVSGNEAAYYGRVYRERKALEIERNAAGTFANLAASKLDKVKIRDAKTRETYESGRLPDGRLELRAERVAVKLFLSHLHHVMYEDRFGERPPAPWIIKVGGHKDWALPPGWPCE